MFPRLSDLINYMLGTDMVLPAKTFGFFWHWHLLRPSFPLRADLKR
ncbi:MAG: hypothetical protein IPN95_16325 [Bacteroidetes bacterium]|nr:hypothetical protein [Bacteroidota bacterium]